MPAFFISAVFGAVQVFLLKFTLKNFTAARPKKALLFLLLKFLLYVAAIGVLIQKYMSHFTNCALGFVAGMPFFAILLFAFTAWRNKDR